MDIQFDLHASCSYMAATHRAGVLRRILGGPHGRLPNKRSHRRPLTQGVLEIGDVARTLAVDSND
jgi:hypothetical protein